MLFVYREVLSNQYKSCCPLRTCWFRSITQSVAPNQKSSTLSEMFKKPKSIDSRFEILCYRLHFLLHHRNNLVIQTKMLPSALLWAGFLRICGFVSRAELVGLQRCESFVIVVIMDLWIPIFRFQSTLSQLVCFMNYKLPFKPRK